MASILVTDAKGSVVDSMVQMWAHSLGRYVPNMFSSSFQPNPVHNIHRSALYPCTTTFSIYTHDVRLDVWWWTSVGWSWTIRNILFICGPYNSLRTLIRAQRSGKQLEADLDRMAALMSWAHKAISSLGISEFSVLSYIRPWMGGINLVGWATLPLGPKLIG